MNIEKGQQQELFLNSLLALVAAGIFVASIFNISSEITIATIVISFVASIMLLCKESKITFIPFCVLFFMLGVMRYQAVNNLPENDISNFAGNEVFITGTIRENPRVRLNADGSYSVRYVVDAETIKIAQKEISVTGGVNINAHYLEETHIPTALIGYKISTYGIIRHPTNYNNPGQLDFVTMLKSEGITASLSAGKVGVEIEHVEGSPWTKFFRTMKIKFLRAMAAIREHYKESMRSVMSSQDAAAIFAMLFGGYEGLNPELVDSFITTGIVHILSVSGSHMSLLAATTAWLCNFLKLQRWLKMSIGLFIIFIYTVLSGFSFPVIRSAFMGFLVFFSTSSESYNKNSRRSLMAVAMFILLYSPLALFHISFQLSFLATAGIVYWSMEIRRFLKNKLRFPLFISMSLSCTISAVVFSEPVIAWYFNQLSPSSLISNLIVIPIIEVVIILGLFAGIVGLIIFPISKVIFLLDSLIFGMAYEINKLIARLPASNIYFPTMSPLWIAFYYVGLILLIQKERDVRLTQTFAIILIAAVIFKASVHLTKTPEMEVHFIDVHQGEAALVITPHGHAMMFDTGGVRDHYYDIGARVDVPYLHHHGINKLDYIFLTHAHEDHAAGAGAIVKQIEVDSIITANESKSEYAASMGISELAAELNNLRSAKEGEIFDIDGVKVEVLYSPKVSNINQSGNEVSNVYKVNFGNASFLFTGDLIKSNEEVILREHKDVKSTVLKVGHHGSKTSSSEEFVEAVQPKYAVFCVGANNTFGHPRPEVVELMENVGAKIYRTDTNGAIVFYTDGNRIKVTTRL